jgi:tetraacyldisaccharide 4'-kinase
LLEEHSECNVIICDDGLQHYALQRDVEICVIDNLRGHGNGRCLPAGPLRESVSRLEQVDLVVYNGGAGSNDFNMTLKPDHLQRVDGIGGERTISDFIGSNVHALAGIGNPQRFFQFLRDLNLQITPHKFKDHHVFSRSDIDFKDQLPVIMTEKDAVKCRAFADQRHWFLQVQPQLSEKNGEQFGDQLLNILKKHKEE